MTHQPVRPNGLGIWAISLAGGLVAVRPTCLDRRIASHALWADSTSTHGNRRQQRIRNSIFAARFVYPPSQESSSASRPIPSAQVTPRRRR
ncbi:hypothetical protein LZ31DRAFT_45559 [Colletotrichum somersetense]|nr:hypothetical protein LZ31DRAFT_45559 [Colletotrichum somersetense]